MEPYWMCFTYFFIFFDFNHSYIWKKKCENCSAFTVKTPKRLQWHCSDVFIANFEQITNTVLTFPLLISCKCQILFHFAMFALPNVSESLEIFKLRLCRFHLFQRNFMFLSFSRSVQKLRNVNDSDVKFCLIATLISITS